MRFSIVHAVTMRGCLPVFMRCSSSCDEISAVVDSVSCAPFRVPVARLAVAQALIDLDG